LADLSDQIASAAMRIAMIASECEPFAKTGGLADVVDALSRALGQLGHDVDVYLPFYRGIPRPEPAERLDLVVPTGNGGSVPVTVWSATGRGYRLRLVEHQPSFDRPDYYVADGRDYPDNGFRFALLGRAALEAMRAERRPADVVHAHDWEGAPALLLLRARYAHDPLLGRVATMLTCHNLAYHGWVPRPEVAGQLDLPADMGAPDGVDLLREGVLRADLVNTVSPTYARESLQQGSGAGLEDALASRGERYLGIINGLDNELWNPATDGDIPARYSAADLSGKRICRAALCAELGLDPGGPVFAMVSRLDPQKGFDLLADAAPALRDAGARICVLGTGDHELVAGLREVAAQRPGRLAVEERFDRSLARRMYAGADAFLMPSRFEPCGQSQMISMRYGTIPVVRATGGLMDTVVDADAEPDRGTGFMFGPADADALFEACRRAAIAMSDSARWSAIRRRAMATDFSWSGPARDYVVAYRRALALLENDDQRV
jgi:starch synthase